jgi:hypothetical protein
MSDTHIHQIKPEQVQGKVIADYIQEKISEILDGKSYKVIKEQTIFKNTYYSRANRHILVYLVESEGQSTPYFFDVTEVENLL